MEQKELFLEAFSTLLYSWGSDAPPEAIWTANDLIKWYNKEFDKKVPEFTREDDISEEYDIIVKAIREE